MVFCANTVIFSFLAANLANEPNNKKAQFALGVNGDSYEFQVTNFI